MDFCRRRWLDVSYTLVHMLLYLFLPSHRIRLLRLGAPIGASIDAMISQVSACPFYSRSEYILPVNEALLRPADLGDDI